MNSFAYNTTGDSLLDAASALLSGQSLQIDESVELEEAHKVGFPLTKKAIKVATDLDADEFEEFLGGMSDYFHELNGEDEGISVRVSTQIAVHFEQAYKIWKKRSQFDESVELEEAVKSFGTTLNYNGSDRMMYKKSVVAFDKAIQVDAVSGIQYFFYDGYNPMVKLANGKYAELSKGELKELRARFKEAGMKFPRPEQ
jgi:hypothetical protein